MQAMYPLRTAMQMVMTVQLMQRSSSEAQISILHLAFRTPSQPSWRS